MNGGHRFGRQRGYSGWLLYFDQGYEAPGVQEVAVALVEKETSQIPTFQELPEPPDSPKLFCF